jgi:hypothetical protein
MAFATRIRAVRFKSGGEVRVLPSGREAKHAELASKIKRYAHRMTEIYAGELAGFIMVAWSVGGESSVGMVNSRFSPMNTSQLPSFLAERVSRAHGEDDAAGIVREMLGIPDEKA